MTFFAIAIAALDERPGARIQTIAAYVDLTGQPVVNTLDWRFTQNVTYTPPVEEHTDPALFKWWQCEATRECRESLTRDALPIREAMVRFHEWVAQYKEPHHFCSRAPHVDWPIYAKVCRALDIPMQFSFEHVIAIPHVTPVIRTGRDLMRVRLGSGDKIADECIKVAKERRCNTQELRARIESFETRLKTAFISSIHRDCTIILISMLFGAFVVFLAHH